MSQGGVMPYIEGQLTFIDFLGYKPVMSMAKRGFFGGPYLDLLSFWAVLASVYESGAVIGRAKRDKLSAIEEMIRTPSLGPKPIEYLQESVKEELDAFINDMKREPHSFIDFVEVKGLGNAIPDDAFKIQLSAIHDSLWGDKVKGNETEEWLKKTNALARSGKKVMKILSRKVPLRGAEIAIRIFGRHGVAFGSLFPELTARMYRNLHENANESVVVTLEEGEGEVLQILAIYTGKFFPELLDTLELRDYLATADERDKQLFSSFRPPRGGVR